MLIHDHWVLGVPTGSRVPVYASQMKGGGGGGNVEQRFLSLGQSFPFSLALETNPESFTYQSNPLTIEFPR